MSLTAKENATSQRSLAEIGATLRSIADDLMGAADMGRGILPAELTEGLVS